MARVCYAEGSMATYVIGDIHGCYQTLQYLLEIVRFDPTQDELWLVGDLVNRGPNSLQVLRWAKTLGDRVICVLGNHDLHLLALNWGVLPHRKRQSLESVLIAPDHGELLEWLRSRPLIYVRDSRVLVHAGLLPQWSVSEALELSREVEEALRGDQFIPLLHASCRQKWPQWNDTLVGIPRLACILQVLTEIRTCTATGRLCHSFSGLPQEAPPDYLPWFAFPDRRSATASLYFGHWAALGVYRRPGVTALDAGCAWGGSLAVVRLEDGVAFESPNRDRPALPRRTFADRL